MRFYFLGIVSNLKAVLKVKYVVKGDYYKTESGLQVSDFYSSKIKFLASKSSKFSAILGERFCQRLLCTCIYKKLAMKTP